MEQELIIPPVGSFWVMKDHVNEKVIILESSKLSVCWENMEGIKGVTLRDIFLRLYLPTGTRKNIPVGDKKPFIVANVREIMDQYEGGEISFSRMVEMFNQVAKDFYEKDQQGTGLIHQDSAEKSLQQGEWYPLADLHRIPMFNGPHSEVVLVGGKGNRATAAYYDFEEKKWTGFGLYDPEQVTHFMVMPKGPNKEAKPGVDFLTKEESDKYAELKGIKPRTPQVGDWWTKGEDISEITALLSGGYVQIKDAKGRYAERYNCVNPHRWDGWIFHSSKADREAKAQAETLAGEAAVHEQYGFREVAEDLTAKREWSMGDRIRESHKVREEVEKMASAFNKKHHPFIKIDGFKFDRQMKGWITSVELL